MLLPDEMLIEDDALKNPLEGSGLEVRSATVVTISRSVFRPSIPNVLWGKPRKAWNELDCIAAARPGGLVHASTLAVRGIAMRTLRPDLRNLRYVHQISPRLELERIARVACNPPMVSNGHDELLDTALHGETGLSIKPRTARAAQFASDRKATGAHFRCMLGIAKDVRQTRKIQLPAQTEHMLGLCRELARQA